MNETLTLFRQAVGDSTDLQEKVRGGTDLVALGKENGFEFTQKELNAGWKELQESDEGLPPRKHGGKTGEELKAEGH